jgi:hypothetical protein
MPMRQPTHAPRPKFDTLFADPRHYRGDCRLMATAIRRGWLDDAPQADRDALVSRFEAATVEREAAGFASEGQRVRVMLANIAAAMALDTANDADDAKALRLAWGGADTGRPRERWHVGEHANRIDANSIRRRAKADGLDFAALEAVDVTRGEGDAERIGLAVVKDARYGWRVFLICPRCRSRRGHLYPVRDGVRCRACAGIVYADPSTH